MAQPGTEPRSFLCKVDGGDITVWTSGRAGLPVILLHGWALDHTMWREQHRQLAGELRLISPDRRGFGSSAAPADLSKEPADILRILDHLGIERVIIAGHSQGARVAAAFSARWPDRVEGLALMGPPDLVGGGMPDTEIPVERFRELARADNIDQLRCEWAQHPLMRTEHATSKLVLAKILDRYSGEDLTVDGQPLAIPLQDLDDATFPLLIITGENETPARKANARHLASRIKRSRHEEISGSAHFPNLENSRDFNYLINSFTK